MTTLSQSETFHRRAMLRFNERARRHGTPFRLTFAGRYQVDSAGHVARAAASPASQDVMGFVSLDVPRGAAIAEKVKKWGPSWTPDGLVMLPPQLSLTGLAGVQNLATGTVYDIVMALPADYGERAYGSAIVRHGPIYNRVVSVSAESPYRDDETPIFDVLPCRLTFLSDGASGQASDDYGFGTATMGRPVMECPFVYDASGKAVLFDPKVTIIKDDPSLSGQQGKVIKYRVAGLNVNPGGDNHHIRVELTYEES